MVERRPWKLDSFLADSCFLASNVFLSEVFDGLV